MYRVHNIQIEKGEDVEEEEKQGERHGKCVRKEEGPFFSNY